MGTAWFPRGTAFYFVATHVQHIRNHVALCILKKCTKGRLLQEISMYCGTSIYFSQGAGSKEGFQAGPKSTSNPLRLNIWKIDIPNTLDYPSKPRTLQPKDVPTVMYLPYLGHLYSGGRSPLWAHCGGPHRLIKSPSGPCKEHTFNFYFVSHIFRQNKCIITLFDVNVFILQSRQTVTNINGG